MALNSGLATYKYPLGTGSSWSHPIEVTRVYVVAPPEIQFSGAIPPSLGLIIREAILLYGAWVDRGFRSQGIMNSHLTRLIRHPLFLITFGGLSTLRAILPRIS